MRGRIGDIDGFARKIVIPGASFCEVGNHIEPEYSHVNTHYHIHAWMGDPHAFAQPAKVMGKIAKAEGIAFSQVGHAFHHPCKAFADRIIQIIPTRRLGSCAITSKPDTVVIAHFLKLPQHLGSGNTHKQYDGLLLMAYGREAVAKVVPL